MIITASLGGEEDMVATEPGVESVYDRLPVDNGESRSRPYARQNPAPDLSRIDIARAAGRDRCDEVHCTHPKRQSVPDPLFSFFCLFSR